MTADRVRIFSRSGIGLCDPRVTAERSWFINDVGEGNFDIVTNDRNCREDYLRFGNWVLIENDKLESWVGMIDVPMEWHKRYVTVRLFSAERFFIYRDVPKHISLSGKSGNIFNSIINIANYAEQTIISAGDIWTGGADLPQENLSGDHLLDYIRKLAKRGNAEFEFVPVTTNGILSIKANWQQRLGKETNFPLEESYNLADDASTLRIQGKIQNQLWGYGSGAGQFDRPVATVTDLESASKYGLREGTKSFSDYQSAGSIQNSLRGEVNRTKDPTYTYKLSALDVGSTFNNIRRGNSYPLRLWSIAFGVKTRTRIAGIYYSPFRGRAELRADEDVKFVME